MSKFALKGNVLLAGGTGFVGSSVARALRTLGWRVTVVSRKYAPNVMTWTELSQEGLPPETKAVINCAGQNVFDKKRVWDETFKQEIWTSRVDTTACLADVIDRCPSAEKPDVFVTMSGVGHYKASDTIDYTEDSPGGNFDFFSCLTSEWEKNSQLKNSNNTRVVNIRSGVVLARHGGAVKEMFWPFYLGVGGRFGSKITYFPWIHLHDLVGMILFSMDNTKVVGPMNGVAPQIITNQEFAKAFGRALKRPTVFPLPTFILNKIFSEERAKLMTEGQRVIPKKALDLGFTYDYPDILSACKEFARVEYVAQDGL